MEDDDLYDAWRAADELGRHEENLAMLDRAIAASPGDAELHLLRAQTLWALERRTDVLPAVHQAIEHGADSPELLTRVASTAFYAGDLAAARRCVDRARALAPPDFVFRDELRELDRGLRRRERGRAREDRLTAAFERDPGGWRVAARLARHLARTGRTYAAYHAALRGLHHRPGDRALRRLAGRLARRVPADVQDEARAWAASGEPFSYET